MEYLVFARPRTCMPVDVLSPLSAEIVSERQLRRGLLIAGVAVYLVVAFSGLDLLN